MPYVYTNLAILELIRYRLWGNEIGSALFKDFRTPPPPFKMEQKSNTLYRVYNNLYKKKLGEVGGTIGAAGPNIRQTRKFML